MRVGRPFRLPGPEYPTVLRPHLPLIGPDVRVSRIRLSDQISRAYAHRGIRRITRVSWTSPYSSYSRKSG